MFQRSRLCTSTLPSITISMKSPPSPSRIISTPGSARYTSMKCASRRTSPCEKFSSSGHFGMSAWICAANCGGVAEVLEVRELLRPVRPWLAAIMPKNVPSCADARLRRFLTASASAASSAVESLPAEAGIGDALAEVAAACPASSSWRPSTRCDSTITPTMRRSPAASCAAMSRATSTCRWYSFAALACEQSIIRRSGSFALASSSHAACDARRVVVRAPCRRAG